MSFGAQIGRRLRALRRARGLPLKEVTSSTGVSLSGVSRLELGERGLRVDQLVAWAGALGLRVDVVMWQPTFFEESWDPAHPGQAMGMDDGSIEVLAEVASALPHLPAPVRESVVNEMRTWRAEARRKRGVGDPAG